MPLYEKGPTTPYNSLGVIPVDIFAVGMDWFVNRTPILTRFPHAPLGSDSFKIVSDALRPRADTLTAAYTTGSSTALTVADSSIYDMGDVLQVESEFFLVTAIPSGTTVTVTGAYAGSTGASHASGSTLYLITNTRTGAEVNIDSMSRISTTVEQYAQTVQHAVSVGGSLNSDYNFVSAEGTPLDRDRMQAIRNCFDDFESAMLFGPGIARVGTTTRPAMKGLRTLISTNRIISPTNASSYKPSDLTRDAIESVYNRGGTPDVLIVSTNFMTGFAIWGGFFQRLSAGDTTFGHSIEVFQSTFVPGATIIAHPLLKPGTIISLSGEELAVRIKRELFEKPRGSEGDAYTADFIMEGAVELRNESHHAWIEGITGFAANS